MEAFEGEENFILSKKPQAFVTIHPYLPDGEMVSRVTLNHLFWVRILVRQQYFICHFSQNIPQYIHVY